jgi:hypothetical protein
MDRTNVVVLLGAVGNPEVSERQIIAELGRLLLAMEETLHRCEASLVKLGVRVVALETAARRPMLDGSFCNGVEP